MVVHEQETKRIANVRIAMNRIRGRNGVQVEDWNQKAGLSAGEHQNTKQTSNESQKQERSAKVYVTVYAKFTTEGILLPVQVVWEDGRSYEISRVTDIRRAASLKAGGSGMRYTCIVFGREVHLYYEGQNLWFMERKG